MPETVKRYLRIILKGLKIQLDNNQPKTRKES